MWVLHDHDIHFLNSFPPHPSTTATTEKKHKEDYSNDKHGYLTQLSHRKSPGAGNRAGASTISAPPSSSTQLHTHRNNHNPLTGNLPWLEPLAGRRMVGGPGVGQHLAIPDDAHSDLVRTALQADDGRCRHGSQHSLLDKHFLCFLQIKLAFSFKKFQLSILTRVN